MPQQVGATPQAAATLAISGAACDSRVVAPGNVFICKGAAFKPAFLTRALEAGASCYLCDQVQADELLRIAPTTARLVVNDIRKAMAIVSAAAWGHPDTDLRIAGMTGTKGKSTVAYMLRSIADKGEPYAHASIMGSIETYDGIEREESHNTTPEAPDLWRHLAQAKATGHDPMIMEISSQALKYERTLGLHVDVVGWLNIGRDHISPQEHKDFEDYFTSKLKIFELSDTAVVNLDTDHLDRVLDAAHKQHIHKLVTLSARGGAASNASTNTDVSNPPADIWAENIRVEYDTVRFCCHTPQWTDTILLSMPGVFNVENALCAIGMAQQLGYSQKEICAGLARCHVPGRMELSSASTPHIIGLVDYAHNQLSFQKFFSSVKQSFPQHKIIAVFGAPGNKAYERRQELPQEASRWADMLIYTSEDPWHESAEKICQDMIAATPAGAHYEVIVDRTKAIYRAVEMAQTWHREGSDSIICMLAKGDEVESHEGDAFVPMQPDGDVFAQAMGTYAQRADAQA